MTYKIRLFRPADAPALADLTLSAIRGVGSRRYSAAQIDAWAARHPGANRFLERDEKGDWIAVAADAADMAVAYALLENEDEASDGHLDMLYCHPAHTRKGLADQLLAHAENHARDQGMRRLFTEASELARPAFERAGYAVTHRRDFEIEGPDGSVSIHNYAMEKHLN
jgi:putative acetyltransferase